MLNIDVATTIFVCFTTNVAWNIVDSMRCFIVVIVKHCCCNDYFCMFHNKCCIEHSVSSIFTQMVRRRIRHFSCSHVFCKCFKGMLQLFQLFRVYDASKILMLPKI
jgi:hypothetical protein